MLIYAQAEERHIKLMKVDDEDSSISCSGHLKMALLRADRKPVNISKCDGVLSAVTPFMQFISFVLIDIDLKTRT